jgi:acetyl esterase/lipase
MNTFNLPLQSTQQGFPASVDVYLRENISSDKHLLPVVIICPGGGYDFLSKRESEPLALAFLAQGFHAIVLNYTTMQDDLKTDFLDATVHQVKQTFDLIDQNKEEWEIDTSKIFLLGCSAGGHLAATYSTRWPEFGNNASRYKPAGTILCYPVTSFQFGWPKYINHFDFTISEIERFNTTDHIDQNTPESFIWHTANDSDVPVLNTLKYCEKLEQNQIKFECHIFESGRHGLSLATRSSASKNTEQYLDPIVASWFQTCLTWLNKRL